ncbi:hypothetical protein EMIT0111MI5_10079 [Burkholderia sp. IT-111MI5]
MPLFLPQESPRTWATQTFAERFPSSALFPAVVIRSDFKPFSGHTRRFKTFAIQTISRNTPPVEPEIRVSPESSTIHPVSTGRWRKAILCNARSGIPVRIVAAA